MTDHDDKSNNNVLDQAAEVLRNAPIHDGPSPRLVAATIDALKSEAAEPGAVRLRTRRELMLRLARYGGLAAAAVAVALIVSISLLDSDPAFADVLQAVHKARSVSFTAVAQFGQRPPAMMRWHQQDHVVRGDMPGMMLVTVDLKTRDVVQLDVRAKRAFQWAMDDEEMETFRQQWRDPIDILTTSKEEKVKQIGRKKIDGPSTVVYQVERLKFAGMQFEEGEIPYLTVWVDPQTKLPLQIALRCSTDRDRKSRDVFLWTDFRWNELEDAAQPMQQIPDDYRVIDGRPSADYIFGQAEPTSKVAKENEPQPTPSVKDIDFSRVIAKVNHATSLTCQAHTKLGGGGIGAELFVNQDGIRRNSLVIEIQNLRQSKAVRFNGDAGFGLLPGSHRAYRWNLEKGQVTEMARRFPNPTALFAAMQSESAEKIREATVEGHPAVVFRLEDVDVARILGNLPEPLDAKLYVSVDPQTELPVEISLACAAPGTEQIKTWYRWQEIRWNEPLDPTLFELKIPEGQTIIGSPPPEGSLWPDLEKLWASKPTKEELDEVRRLDQMEGR